MKVVKNQEKLKVVQGNFLSDFFLSLGDMFIDCDDGFVVHTYVKTEYTNHIKYMQFIVYQLLLNKAILKNPLLAHIRRCCINSSLCIE
jgi:hypothetical protein